MPSSLLIAEAFGQIVFHDIFMWRHTFSDLCSKLRRTAVCGSRPVGEPDSTSQVSKAVDVASALYFKRVLCLQRSAVLCQMLRRRGVNARFVVGIQQSPFKAHAWIEIEGVVVNDPYAEQERFLILEVC